MWIGNFEGDDLVGESCLIVFLLFGFVVYCVYMESEVLICKIMKDYIWDVVGYFVSIVVLDEVKIDRVGWRSDVFC